MDIDGFWVIVERALIGHERDEESDYGHAETLRRVLEPLSDDELADFHNLYFALEHRAERIDVWGAGYLLNGGMSDDSFTDFRSWLISRGRVVYESVLADPDALADVVSPLTVGYSHSASSDAHVAAELYSERHDQAPPSDFERCEALVEASIPPAERERRESPLASVFWEEDDGELERLYPKLAALVAAQPPDSEPGPAPAPLSPEQVAEFHRMTFLLALGELVISPLELRQTWYADDTVIGVQIVGEPRPRTSLRRPTSTGGRCGSATAS